MKRSKKCQYPKIPLGRVENLTGRQFGRLTVLYRTKSSNGSTLWVCKCSCKEESYTVISSSHLKSGHTKSCGCLSKENLKKAQQGIDITRQTFGKLTALSVKLLLLI